MPVFFFLFIVMPIAELAVLIQVGSVIGVLNTVGLVFLTAVIGAWLLRQQGLEPRQFWQPAAWPWHLQAWPQQ